MQSLVTAAVPFRRPEQSLGGLSADTAAEVVAAASDLALVLDADGVVRDLSINSVELSRSRVGDWLDRRWIDTVSGDSRHKVAEMLHDAAAGGSYRWREVNHPTDSGDNLPIRYFAIDGGEDGKVLVIGRDLRASAALQQRLVQVQQSLERDYVRLRQAESRYRLLFQTASEPVLIIDAASRRVREANPAAARLLETAEDGLEGQPIAALFDPASLEEAAHLLAAVQAGAIATTAVKLVSGGVATLGASLFRQDRTTCLLVRLTPEAPPAPGAVAAARLSAVLERISDAFVVTDPELAILTVNPAFLDLTQVASIEDAQGQPLDRFLGRPHIDFKIMLSQLREHGALRNFSTVVRDLFGGSDPVEVSAVAALDAEPPCFGFSIRGVARRLSAANVNGEPPRSVEQLTQLIGRVPMKEIVRESSDLIERLCIEAALKLTANNRASAADLLGLSRQSLYSKLHRYGLGDLNEPKG